MWLKKRRIITLAQLPEFPEIKYELGMRQIIDKETQRAIIDEAYRISYDINPKIWLGIRWLSIYIAIRPGELLSLKEKEIDAGIGSLLIPSPKEKKPKMVFLIDEDIEILKQFPRGLPDLPFFRHPKGISGAKPGSKFGQRYLYKWWKKACANLGIEGVDMYGGTRHSTATALSETMTPEQIKSGTMHSTNKAFDRYFQARARQARLVYEEASKSLQQTYNNIDNKNHSKILKLK
jgi:integrase